MKAYQMRITLEDSKPAIYRQCIVPAGITFSQFALLLNRIMGWEDEHLFSFQFPKVAIEEANEECDMGVHGHSTLEASTTYVNEYLENNAMFMYLYDFGDNWEHRVEIEAVLDSYEFNYPQVLKYKGACPVEDCGGINAFYHMMDILKDHKHPDYDETLEWALSMGYTNTYSQKKTNAVLQEYYFVTEGKGEKRQSFDLLQDLAKKKGLKASKNPKNPTNVTNITDISTYSKAKKTCSTIPNEIKSSMLGLLDGEYSVDEMNAQIAELTNQLIENMEDIDMDAMNADGFAIESHHALLKDMIKGESKSDLAKIASTILDTPVKSLKKSELVQKIAEYLLNPEIMYQNMLLFNDDSITLFQKIIDAGGAYMPSLLEFGNGQLLASGYVILRSDEGFEIADDVIEVFQSIDSPEYQSRRKQISWLLQCLCFSNELYGASPLKVLAKLYNKGKGLKITQKDLAILIEDLPVISVIKVGDLYVNFNRVEDQTYEDLLMEQGNVDYYIPTREEIIQLFNDYVLPDNETQTYLQDFLLERKDANPFIVVTIVSQIQIDIRHGASMEEILSYLEEQPITIPKSKKKKLQQLLNAVYQNTRMLSLRGFTRSEVKN